MLFDIINKGGRPRKGRCVMMEKIISYNVEYAILTEDACAEREWRTLTSYPSQIICGDDEYQSWPKNWHLDLGLLQAKSRVLDEVTAINDGLRSFKHGAVFRIVKVKGDALFDKEDPNKDITFNAKFSTGELVGNTEWLYFSDDANV